MDEVKKVLDAQLRAWDEFKKTNDEKIAALEAKQTTADFDVKLAKINTAIEEHTANLKALQAANERVNDGDGPARENVSAHRKAFAQWARKGNNEGELREIERKSVSVGVSADGGYALPEEIDRAIGKTLVDISPMRQVADVVQVSTTDYKRLHDRNGIASGWVGETTARTAGATSTLAEIPAFMGEVYANPQATQVSIEDLLFNVESWLANGVAEEFARAENAAFLNGTGTNQPKGILQYTFAATADASRTFGQFEYVATGVSADWAASNKGDKLIDLVYKLKAGHRAGAMWMVPKSILAEIRQFKDTTGQYLFQPSLSSAQPATLLGYQIVEAEDMPVKAASSLSVLFGNFKKGYCIVDRVGMTTLRDPYSNKPYVGFYTRKRVGGMAVDTDAIKALKFSVS